MNASTLAEGSEATLGQQIQARARGDVAARRWEEGIARWSLYVNVAPTDVEALAMLILCCREAGWLQEAEWIGGSAVKEFPKDWRIRTEWSLIPLVSRDWALAAERWAIMRHTFPDDVHALLRSAAVSEELEKLEEAEAFLKQARDKADMHGEVLADSARFNERRGNFSAAAEMWRLAANQQEERVELIEYLCQSLNQAGRFVDAEKVVAEQLELGKLTKTLLVEYARAAAGRGDWAVAVARWQAVVENFPEDLDAKSRLGEVMWHQQVAAGVDRSGSARVPLSSPSSAGGQPQARDEKAVTMSFESLGDNCEFGLVQRHYGSEPVGLYRWAGVTVDSLIEALNARLEGIGDPEYTLMKGQPGDEYVVRDHRNWLASHTFVPFNEEKFVWLRDRQFAALRFLRDRLLQDLMEPWKIFVFKPRFGKISDDEMITLHKAMQALGDSALLCVSVPDAERETGSVVRHSRGLYRGSISKVSPTARRDEIDYVGWLELCRAALHLAERDGFMIGYP